MQGILRDRPHDAHVALRERVLRQEAWYPAPPGADPHMADAGDLETLAERLRTGLAAHGSTIFPLNRLLTNQELLAVAERLGRVQALDPTLHPWAEQGLILNIRAERAEMPERDWRTLFAENYLKLHSELADRPLGVQPRYLLFQCVEPPRRDSGGQTVLVPMEAVRRRLDPREAAILTGVRWAKYRDPPPFLSWYEGREVFALDDFEGETLLWRYEGEEPGVTREEVESVLRALILAMYQPNDMLGLHWEQRSVAAFDNHRYFHGRTFVPPSVDGPPRHLRQVRVFPAAAPAS
jgi:alpha-ketoglutarate-dependent taurine dioxygenase